MGIFDRFRQRLRDRPAQSDAPGLFTARSGAVPPELGGTPGGGTAADDDLWNRPAPAREPAPEPTTEDPEVEDPEVEDPEVEALSAFDPEPPAPADHVQHTDLVDAASGPAWDESTWADDEAADAEPIPEPEPGPEPGPEPERAELPVDGGSTADEPLFGAYEEAPAPVAPPPTDPVPPLFEHPPVAAEPAPADLVEPPQAGDAPQAGTDAEGGRTMRVHDGRLDKRPGPIRMTPSEAIALAQDGPQALRRRTHPDTGPTT